MRNQIRKKRRERLHLVGKTVIKEKKGTSDPLAKSSPTFATKYEGGRTDERGGAPQFICQGKTTVEERESLVR